MRLQSLDAVRGIAATVVVAHHASLVFPSFAAHGPEVAWLLKSPLRLFVAGPAAVYVFFVLSGTVLSLPFFAGHREAWLPFAVKRVVRIWVPFAFAILLSACLAQLIGRGPMKEVSWWFNCTWKTPISFDSLASTLGMSGRDTDLDNPMWSLIHEMRIALVLPFIMMLMKRSPYIVSFVAFIGCLLSASLFADWHYTNVISWADTATYVFAFVTGVLIAAKRELLVGVLERLNGAGIIGLLGLSLLGLAATPAETHPLTTIQPTLRFIANTIAAAFLICLCMRQRGWLAYILNGRFPQFLGRISYSLYLVHVPILIATVRLLAGPVGIPLAMATGLVTSFCVAVVFQRFIEAPAAQLGKRLSRVLEPKRHDVLVVLPSGQTAVAGW